MVAQSCSNHSLNEKQNCASSNCLISLPFSIPPIFKQHSKSNLQLLTMAENSSNAVRHLQDSITSAVDKCFRLVHSIVSHHPLGNKLLNLSSQFKDFCQVRCRTYQNMGNLSHQNFAAILPGDSVAGVVAANGVLNFLNLYNTLLVVRLVLTWFPNAPPAIVSPLSTICDPYLNIFRGLIPPLGGTLDLSPILAFLLLNALTSTASALPAELPSTATTTEVSSNIPSHTPVSHLTTSQKKWMRRLAGNKSENTESKS